jgi:hypothetical protein
MRGVGGGGELRCTPVNGGGFRVVLQPGWGEDEVSNPGIGGQRHEERPPPTMAAAAASPRGDEVASR